MTASLGRTMEYKVRASLVNCGNVVADGTSNTIFYSNASVVKVLVQASTVYLAAKGNLQAKALEIDATATVSLFLVYDDESLESIPASKVVVSTPGNFVMQRFLVLTVQESVVLSLWTSASQQSLRTFLVAHSNALITQFVAAASKSNCVPRKVVKSCISKLPSIGARASDQLMTQLLDACTANATSDPDADAQPQPPALHLHPRDHRRVCAPRAVAGASCLLDVVHICAPDCIRVTG